LVLTEKLLKAGGADVQEKQRVVFCYFACWLACGLCMGCHSGPVYTGDSAYRTIERESDRNSVELAITGADIAAGVDRIGGHADRIAGELSGVEMAIGGSSLGEAEKSVLLHQVSVAQAEAGALVEQVAGTRADVEQLNVQLARQREINAALSEEHDKREAVSTEVKEDLAATKEKLAEVSGQRNLAVVIAAALVIFGAVAIRVLRFLRFIPV
jgi:hypothetical protein